MIENVKQLLNLDTDEITGCLAVVNEADPDNIQLCGNDVFGEGTEVRYCRRHVPSAASPSLNRVEPVKFYLPEKEEIVERE